MNPFSKVRQFSPKKEPTSLYFIESACAKGHIKIGVASNVLARLSSLQNGCPYQLRLIKRIPGAAHMEKELHERFEKDKLFREWFRRSDELLAVIADMDGLDFLEETTWAA